MKRRGLISGALAAATLSVAHEGAAQGVMNAGLSPGALPHIYATQRCPEWCWAASLEMLTRSAGKPVDQTTIVGKTFGPSVPCVTGGIQQMIRASNGTYRGVDGGAVRLRARNMYFLEAGLVPPPQAFNNATIIDRLNNDEPLLYGNSHHCMVLIAVSYIPALPYPNIVRAVVLDPWPGMGVHPLTQAELFPAHRGGEMHFLGAIDVG
jgi:hypothetical protein